MGILAFNATACILYVYTYIQVRTYIYCLNMFAYIESSVSHSGNCTYVCHQDMLIEIILILYPELLEGIHTHRHYILH